jgi:threonine dehydrogenase-like Zn-dependent dehydrogenase
LQVVVWGPDGAGGLRPAPRPAPTPRADEVLVEVEAAAVAGPELLALAGGDGAAGAAVGRVVAAGDAARHHQGARVVVGPVRACGECEACRRGRPAACPHAPPPERGVASHVVAPARWLLPLAGPLEGVAPGPAAAALAREAPLAYELHARAGVAPGDATVWLGDGAIAAFGAQIARAKGGAAFALTAEERALPPAALGAALRDRLAGAGVPREAPWHVLETTGRDAWRRRALALATPGGTLAFLSGAAAGTEDPATLALAAALGREVVMIGVRGAHPDLMPEVAALVARGELDLDRQVMVRPVRELAAVVAGLRAGDGGDQLTVVAFG